MNKTLLAVALSVVSSTSFALNVTTNGGSAIVTSSIGTNYQQKQALRTFGVACTGNASHIAAQVMDLPAVKNSLLSVQLMQGSKVSPIESDMIDGDAAYSLPVVIAFDTPAIYRVNVSKSLSVGSPSNFGQEGFKLKVTCFENGVESQQAPFVFELANQ